MTFVSPINTRVVGLLSLTKLSQVNEQTLPRLFCFVQFIVPYCGALIVEHGAEIVTNNRNILVLKIDLCFEAHCSKTNMQATKVINLSYQRSCLLVPTALRTNRATRKMLNLETNEVKLITCPGKVLWQTKKTEGNLTEKSKAKLKLATVSVGTIVGRSVEATETIGRTQLNAVALQELRYEMRKQED